MLRSSEPEVLELELAFFLKKDGGVTEWVVFLNEIIYRETDCSFLLESYKFQVNLQLT